MRQKLRQIEEKNKKYILNKNPNPKGLIMFCEDKMQVFEYFRNNMTVPETMLFTKENAEKFFNMHQQAVLKPRYGSKGKGIMLAEKGEDHTGLRDYLIQEMIVPEKYDKKCWDVRVLVQNINKITVGMYSRVSDNFVTNIFQGGSVESTEKIINSVSAKEQNIVVKLDNCTKKIISYIENKYDFVEIGIDFLVDAKGNVFLIEINTMPGIGGFFEMDNRGLIDKRLLSEILENRLLIRESNSPEYKKIDYGDE
ncbi:MAG: YheC/YheD family protein [Nanoarchaeota archaeon]|nr:YheC/YheD family protein [Nanoarchaeota archaeon]